MTVVVVGLLAAVVVVALVKAAKAEQRRTDAYVESLRRMARRCPDCRGLGWHFGPPGTGDPAISTPTCTTCGGSGELAS